ncbi:putative disease resistance protein RGA4 [Corylus avellana]|uniref:putative disease resistance protein RGA4 n=1 Tax=Corylus avellana TaxID=13451 RepID=UPI00286B0136|nr:putative disease resistance protein RGA4 [Corylus avellana]
MDEISYLFLVNLYHRSMKHIVKNMALLVGISASWFGLFNTSMEITKALPKGMKIADLYAKEAVYGLTQLLREEVKSARLVANPGLFEAKEELTENQEDKYLEESVRFDFSSGKKWHMAQRKSQITERFKHFLSGKKWESWIHHHHIAQSFSFLLTANTSSFSILREMEERLLFGVVEGIIKSLGSPASKEIGLLWGVEDEVERLANTVSTIKDLLLDAEEKQAVGDHAVARWLGRLEDAMYDADDLLDAVSTEALRREIMTHDKNVKQVRIFFSKSNQLAYGLKKAHKIKAMRERLDAINAAARDFHLKVRQVETRVRNRERDNTHSFVPVDKVIGRKNDKKAIIDRLVDSNVEENVSILPIVGIGGLGKTTLAQLIFNDEQIEKHFELKLWVCVSDNFDVKNIAEKILESAIKRKPETIEMDTLIGYLKGKIDGKKYLLVLDDVWNEDQEKWSRLKELLVGGARGSRILVTTRNESVARLTGTVQSYFLRGLDEDASWSLFKQVAFGKGQEPENSSIIVLGREILEKCLGVPLAIRTIGGLLGSKNPETEWLSFKKQELSKISQKENDILPTLKLSYDHLPSELKHCFVYCSLFPKDYWIRKSLLINLWIAQGCIKLTDHSQCLEDVGHEYFMDLLWRSFFQEAEMDTFGNIIGFKIHDLIHDLALSVAGSLITTFDDKERNIDEKTRHVSFGGYDIDISSLCNASRIRTFLCLDDGYVDPSRRRNIDCNAIFSSFKFLRFLNLHLKFLDFVPSSIGRLKHLRYRDLSENSKMKKLPNSITRLQNLQTLRLSNCTELEELPRDIKKLVNLRHLEIDGCLSLTYMPLGLGQLTNLQTLSTFVVHWDPLSKYNSGLKELNRLNNLRGELAIIYLRHGEGVASEYKVANLKEKQHLHTLRLRCENDEAPLEDFQPHPNLKQLEVNYYQGSRLPSWLLSLTNLVKFELLFCEKCQYLPPLSQLPSLKYLSLQHLYAMEYISVSDEFSSSSSARVPFFPSLKEMSLYRCPNLKGWWKTRDSSVEINCNNNNSVEITARVGLVECKLEATATNNDDEYGSTTKPNVNNNNLLFIQSSLKIEVYKTKIHCRSRNSARGVVEESHFS